MTSRSSLRNDNAASAHAVEENIQVAINYADDRHYILDEGCIVEQVTSEELRADEALRQQYLGV